MRRLLQLSAHVHARGALLGWRPMHSRAPRLLATLLLASTCLPALAALPDGPPPTLATAWRFSPWTLVPLLVLITAYAMGLRRRWHAPGVHRPRLACRAFAFAGGVLALALVLVWPLAAFAAYALSAHVAQHMTLLALAPPLLLAGHAFGTVAAAAPCTRPWPLGEGLRRPLAWLTGALAPATVVHVATMLLWHLPGAIGVALASNTLHRTMAASVLLAGLWFWAAIWRRLRAPDAGVVGGVIALATAMMLMGFLGALLTFSPRLLYPAFSDRGLLLGIDPLRDQALAGLLMWVPGGLPYIVMGLALVVALIRSGRPEGLPGTG